MLPFVRLWRPSAATSNGIRIVVRPAQARATARAPGNIERPTSNIERRMNVGFANLTTLKAHLLATQLQSDTDYDAKLTAIGLGVAKAFAHKCNCDFDWMIGATEVTQGDRDHWYVRRRPVSEFTGINLRYFRADPWTDISGQPMAADEFKGLIHFGYTLGTRPIQVQIIYNGGYWWEQQEPTLANGTANPDYPTPLPAEITAAPSGLNQTDFMLPDDLIYAWLTQCRKAWESVDKLGTQIVRVGSNAHNPADVLAGQDLVPEVQKILQQYVRYQLT